MAELQSCLSLWSVPIPIPLLLPESPNWEWTRFFPNHFLRRRCAESWSNYSMAFRVSVLGLAALLTPLSLNAQTSPDLAKIMERLDRLEQENHRLSEQVRELQTQLGTPASNAASVEEKLDIQEKRIEETAQTKVEASQKFPIRLAGMALFNAFSNSKQ